MKNILSKLGHYSFVKKEKATIKIKIVGLVIMALSLVFIAGCDNNNAANKAAADKRYNDSVSQSKNQGEGEHGMKGHDPMNGHDSMMKGHKEQH